MVSRRLLVLFGATLVLICLAYTAYWFIVMDRFRSQVEAWAETKRPEGWDLTWAKMETEGFPFHMGLRLQEVKLRSPALSWATGNVTLGSDPFDLTRFRMNASGPHEVSWNDQAFRINMSRLLGNLDTKRDGRVEQLTFLVSDLAIDAGALSGKIAHLALTWDAEESLFSSSPARFSGTASGVELPDLPNLILGRNLSRLGVEGRVLGKLPSQLSLDAVKTWLMTGGTVELNASLAWEPLTLEGSGSIALDPQGQPLVMFSSRMQGVNSLLDRFVERGLLPESSAKAVKLLVTLASLRGDGIPVPITIQNGALFFGPTRVMGMPALAW